MYNKIIDFEKEIAEFTGAPYVIVTDCCTHALEMCFLYDQVKNCEFTAYTYLSVPMTMHKLGIKYHLIDQKWVGEYRFYQTRIWDSARRLEPNMYRAGQMQCLSFGVGKPVDNNRGGAILLDDPIAADAIRKMRFDGRDLTIIPWIDQKEFNLGFHYKLNPDECIRGLDKLREYVNNGDYTPKNVEYPDCRQITIK